MYCWPNHYHRRCRCNICPCCGGCRTHGCCGGGYVSPGPIWVAPQQPTITMAVSRAQGFLQQ